MPNYNAISVKPYHLKVNYMSDICEAIVEAAIDDYFRLKAGFISPSNDCSIEELTSFFKSEYYESMCKLSGEYIMRELDKRAAKCILKYVVARGSDGRYYIHNYDHYQTMDRVKNANGYSSHYYAQRKAAHMNELDYKDYVLCCKRDGVDIIDVED